MAIEETKSAPKTSDETKAVEVWCAELNTEAWLFAAAKMHAGWPQGRTVTRPQFEAALKAAGSVTSR